MRVFYSELAKRNISEIANYTEKERGKLKRIELVQQIANNIETIVQFPRSAKFDVDLGLHYKIIPRLPFVIVYSVESDFIRIVRLVHTKRRR